MFIVKHSPPHKTYELNYWLVFTVRSDIAYRNLLYLYCLFYSSCENNFHESVKFYMYLQNERFFCGINCFSNETKTDNVLKE